ncbi:RapGAP/RanGAP domain-containing protein [Tieghemostelium lacteum]|uniref:RapGAP/RanGAP domain-containing protein n=1 Tax=Tieghemostelium lacteum TaxID=361077 RepID=A0A151Z6B4_TIELA|nr:RapGAP/RanGAP domain-containing protein [Tieghemostelium lacteum]|eukprot:KYQ89478.1 RapGAP/RanGAP domain-containing protein [Tieghemostelium lacteum]
MKNSKFEGVSSPKSNVLKKIKDIFGSTSYSLLNSSNQQQQQQQQQSSQQHQHQHQQQHHDDDNNNNISASNITQHGSLNYRSIGYSIHDIQVINDRLKSELQLYKNQTIGTRLTFLRELCDYIKLFKLESIEQVWNLVSDLVEDNKPLESQLVTIQFMISIVDSNYGMLGDLRLEFFRLITSKQTPSNSSQNLSSLSSLMLNSNPDSPHSSFSNFNSISQQTSSTTSVSSATASTGVSGGTSAPLSNSTSNILESNQTLSSLSIQLLTMKIKALGCLIRQGKDIIPFENQIIDILIHFMGVVNFYYNKYTNNLNNGSTGSSGLSSPSSSNSSLSSLTSTSTQNVINSIGGGGVNTTTQNINDIDDSQKSILGGQLSPNLANYHHIPSYQSFQELFTLIENIIRNAANLLSEGDIASLINTICLLSNSSTSLPVIELCLSFFDVITKMVLIPPPCVSMVISSLCKSVNIEYACNQSWRTMQNILEKYGNQGIHSLCSILNDPQNRLTINLLRGAVFFIGMSIWGSQRVQSLNVPPSFVLPALFNSLSGKQEIIAYEVILALRRLVKKYGCELHVEWDLILLIIEKIWGLLAIGDQDHTNSLFIVLRDTIVQIEELDEKDLFEGSKSRLFQLSSQFFKFKSEDQILQVIEKQQIKMHPSHALWIEKIQNLIELFFRIDPRPRIRKKILDLVKQSYFTYRLLYGEEILEKVIVPTFYDIYRDRDIGVRLYGIEIIIDILYNSTVQQTSIFHSLITILDRSIRESSHSLVNTSQLEISKISLSGLLQIFSKQFLLPPPSLAIELWSLIFSHLNNDRIFIRKEILSTLSQISSNKWYQIQYQLIPSLFLHCSESNQFLNEVSTMIKSPRGNNNSINSNSLSSNPTAIGTSSTNSTSSSNTLQQAPQQYKSRISKYNDGGYFSISIIWNHLLERLSKESNFELYLTILDIFSNFLKNKYILISLNNFEIQSLVNIISKSLNDKNLGISISEFQGENKKEIIYILAFEILCNLVYYAISKDKENTLVFQSIITTLFTGLCQKWSFSNEARLKIQTICLNGLMICLVEFPIQITLKYIQNITKALHQITTSSNTQKDTYFSILQYLNLLVSITSISQQLPFETLTFIFKLLIQFIDKSKYTPAIILVAFQSLIRWFTSCSLSYRVLLVKNIIKSLDQQLKEKNSLLIEVCIELLNRYIHTNYDPFHYPIRNPSNVFQCGQTKTWIQGSSLITIKTGKLGWAEVTLRKPTGCVVWLMRFQDNNNSSMINGLTSQYDLFNNQQQIQQLQLQLQQQLQQQLLQHFSNQQQQQQVIYSPSSSMSPTSPNSNSGEFILTNSEPQASTNHLPDQSVNNSSISSNNNNTTIYHEIIDEINNSNQLIDKLSHLIKKYEVESGNESGVKPMSSVDQLQIRGVDKDLSLLPFSGSNSVSDPTSPTHIPMLSHSKTFSPMTLENLQKEKIKLFPSCYDSTTLTDTTSQSSNKNSLVLNNSQLNDILNEISMEEYKEDLFGYGNSYNDESYLNLKVPIFTPKKDYNHDNLFLASNLDSPYKNSYEDHYGGGDSDGIDDLESSNTISSLSKLYPPLPSFDEEEELLSFFSVSSPNNSDPDQLRLNLSTQLLLHAVPKSPPNPSSTPSSSTQFTDQQQPSNTISSPNGKHSTIPIQIPNNNSKSLKNLNNSLKDSTSSMQAQQQQQQNESIFSLSVDDHKKELVTFGGRENEEDNDIVQLQLNDLQSESPVPISSSPLSKLSLIMNNNNSNNNINDKNSNQDNAIVKSTSFTVDNTNTPPSSLTMLHIPFLSQSPNNSSLLEQQQQQQSQPQVQQVITPPMVTQSNQEDRTSSPLPLPTATTTTSFSPVTSQSNINTTIVNAPTTIKLTNKLIPQLILQKQNSLEEISKSFKPSITPLNSSSPSIIKQFDINNNNNNSNSISTPIQIVNNNISMLPTVVKPMTFKPTSSFKIPFSPGNHQQNVIQSNLSSTPQAMIPNLFDDIGSGSGANSTNQGSTKYGSPFPLSMAGNLSPPHSPSPPPIPSGGGNSMSEGEDEQQTANSDIESDPSILDPSIVFYHLHQFSGDVTTEIKTGNHAFQRALTVLDHTFCSETYKIGVLYVGPDQTTEEQIFSNSKGSPRYQQFLQDLGETIRLSERIDVYPGGLDRNGKTDGEFSIYWKDRITQVIFHVATLMPTNIEQDPTFTNKKRHIGNDYVNIIYSDSPNAQFNQNIISGQFNFVNIIIHPLDLGCYRIEVKKKKELSIFGPIHNHQIISSKSLPSLLIQTAINANLMSMQHDGKTEFISNLEERLKQIKTIKERFAKEDDGWLDLISLRKKL